MGVVFWRLVFSFLDDFVGFFLSFFNGCLPFFSGTFFVSSEINVVQNYLVSAM